MEAGLDPNKEYREDSQKSILSTADKIKELFKEEKPEGEEEIKQFIKGYLYVDRSSKKSFDFSPVQLPYEEMYKDLVERKELPNFNECLVQHFKQFSQEKTEEELEKEIEKEAMKKF